jgi:hypothetical protein
LVCIFFVLKILLTKALEKQNRKKKKKKKRKRKPRPAPFPPARATGPAASQHAVPLSPLDDRRVLRRLVADQWDPDGSVPFPLSIFFPEP